MKRLLAVLLLVAACALPPLYLLGTADGARRAAGYAADRLGLELTVTGGTLWSGLQIESLGWSADGNSVVASDIDLQPRWRLSCLLRSRVCLEVLALQALSVTMPARAADSTPGLQLPRELELPVGIAIRTLRVAELRVQEGETVHVVRGIHARLRLDEAAIALRDVALEHDAAAFAGHLSLGLADDWPLRARLTAELREGALANLVSGADFQSLELALEAQGLQSVPAVAALQPWLQPRGPVALRARLRPGVVRLEVESQLAGYASEALALDARLSGDAGRWALDRLTLTDSAGLERLALRGPLGRAPDWAPTLNVQLRDLSLPPESGIPLTRVAALAELRLRPADTAALSWQLSRVQASAVYDATPITLQGTLTSAGDHALLPLGSLRGSARDIAFSYTRPVSPGPARLQLPDGLRSDSLQLTRIDAELTPGARSEVLLTVDGDVITTLSLAFEETAAGADWQLQPFDAEVFGQPLASGSSMQGSWLRDSAELLVQPFCWRLRDMSLCSELARLGESGSVDLRLEGGEEWQGALGDNPYSVVARGDGQLHAEWSAAGFQSAALSMRLPVLGIDPFLGAGTEAPTQFEDVTVDAHATPETQTLTLRGGSTSLGQLSADLRRDGVDLSGQVRLAELTLPAFDDLLPEVDLTAGLLSGTLYVAGTLQEPEFSGALELRDGGAMLPGHQVVMSDAQLYLGGRMDAFEVRGDALLGGGPVKIDGRCCDDDVLRLTLDSERNVLRLPMGLDATISADLAARWMPSGPRSGATFACTRGCWCRAARSATVFPCPTTSCASIRKRRRRDGWRSAPRFEPLSTRASRCAPSSWKRRWPAICAWSPRRAIPCSCSATCRCSAGFCAPTVGACVLRRAVSASSVIR